MLSKVKTWLGLRKLSDEEFERERQRLLAERPVPVFWLFGKTGSGKSSVIRYLTGATDVEIGSGFRPCTQSSRLYDFPNPDQPIVRFLDTRGLGEVNYDPTEDLRQFDAQTHVVVVTVRAMDHALDEVVAPLERIRAAKPSRPVVLALTALHDAYPGEQHPEPDPFGDGPPWPNQLPADLLRSLNAQRDRFAGRVDRMVPIDFTPPEEGFAEPNFGGRRLDDALVAALPAAYRQAFLSLHDVRRSLQNLTVRKALPLIITYSSLAATAAAVPTPWVDIPVVMGLQTHLVYRLAELYGQRLETDLLLKLAGAVGGRLLARFAVRAPLKFIPFLGQTANAAMAFAYTYSLGQACCWYFGEVKAGHMPSAEDLNRVWGEQLESAVVTWKSARGEDRGSGT
jgi:uncharacterized protein (DUF697 family)/predicted GTPase